MTSAGSFEITSDTKHGDILSQVPSIILWIQVRGRAADDENVFDWKGSGRLLFWLIHVTSKE